MAAATPRKDQMRVVDNNTATYAGGYSVELADGTVLAGPYSQRDYAREAKDDLAAGRPVRRAA